MNLTQLRIVLDTRLRLTPDAQLIKTVAFGPVMIVAGEHAPAAARKALEAKGARVSLCASGPNGIEVPALLQGLSEEDGIESILVEGGGKVAASFLRAGMVDRIEWFRAPLIMGAEGRPGIAETGVETLAQASRWKRIAARALEDDLWETYERV